MPGDKLEPEEDAALRRLHWFEGLGCELSSALQILKTGFRSLDRRAEVRAPGATYDKSEHLRHEVPSYWARGRR